jgi:molybdenum cofactor guanylyltransferase
MPDLARAPAGAVLAGGAGRRIGGAKALAELAGRPLIEYPLAAMRAAGLSPLAIVAKPDTELPALVGVQIWLELERTRHPLIGLVEALRRAGGQPVVVCAADMPLVRAETIATLAASDPGDSPAVVASSPDRGIQPLLGLYLPAAAELLAPAARAACAPLRATVAALGPRLLEVADAELLNVNSAADLAHAQARISRT